MSFACGRAQSYIKMMKEVVPLVFLSCFANVSCAYGEVDAGVGLPIPVVKAGNILGRTIEEVEDPTQDLAWRSKLHYEPQMKQRLSANKEYLVNYGKDGIAYAVFVRVDLPFDYSIKAANRENYSVRLFYHDMSLDADLSRSSNPGCYSWEVGRRRYNVITVAWKGRVRVNFSILDIDALSALRSLRGFPGESVFRRDDECVDLLL